MYLAIHSMIKEFGKLPSGKQVFTYTIKNNAGLTLSAINLGGIITSLQIPFHTGLVNTVLGYSSLEPYLTNVAYVGAIIGRYANRIKNGEFKLGNRHIQVYKNNGQNHLHGGLYGFDRQFWEIEIDTFENHPALLLSYVSKDGEEGYPGELKTEVIYQLKENTLRVIFKARTNLTTAVNLTQHSYFNLSEVKTSITQNLLQILSDRFAPVDETQIPNNGLIPVTQTPFDCRTAKRIHDILSQNHAQLVIGEGIDHSWETSKNLETPIAILINEEQKRAMSVYTNQPALHVYTGNHLKDMGLPKHAAICFETQHFPDTINQPTLGNSILTPTEEYYHETIFTFFDA
jgi:aldose 1-epimerase